MKFIVKNDNVAVTGVVEGKPPARGDVLDIGGAKYEVIVTTQIYESGSGGSKPQPFLTSYVRPTSEELAKRSEQQRAAKHEQAVENVRSELRLDGFDRPRPQPSAAQGPPPAPPELSEETRRLRRWLERGDESTPSPLPGATSPTGALTTEDIRRELDLDLAPSGEDSQLSAEKMKQELAL